MTPGDHLVHGFLLTFLDPAVLHDLDWLEEYDPSRPLEENEYERREILTAHPAGYPLEAAWAYLMSRERVQQLHGILLPTGWWSSCGLSLDEV